MPRITSVTLSVAAKVWLTQFRGFSPHASVTVAMDEGDEFADAVNLGLKHLRPAYFSALRAEIGLVGEAQEVLGENVSVEDLVKYCERQVLDVAGDPTFRIETTREVEVGKENQKGNKEVRSTSSGGGRSKTIRKDSPAHR